MGLFTVFLARGRGGEGADGEGVAEETVEAGAAVKRLVYCETSHFPRKLKRRLWVSGFNELSKNLRC